MRGVLSLVLFLLLTTLVQAEGFEEDLVYEGKSLRTWLEEVRGKDSTARRRASRVLRRVGPEAQDAVPALLLSLRTDDQVARKRVSLTLARIGPSQVPILTAALGFEEEGLVSGAALALGFLGPPARPATRALERQLGARSPMVQASAALALWQIDRSTAGLPTLRKLLLGTEIEQLWGAWALTSVGRSASGTAGDLATLLGSKQDGSRDFAFQALERMGPPAVPGLLSALPGKTIGARIEIVEALGRLGPGAKDAIPVLLPLASEGTPGLRVAAVRALGRIGIAQEDVVEALRLAARDTEPDIRLEATRSLGAVRAVTALPELRLAMQDPVRAVRTAGSQALARMGSPAIPVLTGLLADPDPLVPRQALRSLVLLGPEAAPAAEAVTALIVAPGTSRRLTAVEALEAMGPAGAGGLTRALTGAPETQVPAARALSRLGPLPERESLSVLEIIRTAPHSVRQALLPAIGSMESSARSAVPLLVTMAREPESLPGVLSALIAIRPEGQEMLPLIRDALDDGRSSVRQQALQLAAATGSDVRPLTTALVRRLADEDSSVARQAAALLLLCGEEEPLLKALDPMIRQGRGVHLEVALGCVAHLRGRAKTLGTPLARLVLDPDPGIRGRAVVALHALGRPAIRLQPIVEGILEDPEARKHPRILTAVLEGVESRTEGLAKPLVDLLSASEEVLLRTQMAAAVGTIGPEARGALPALLELLLDLQRIEDVYADEMSDTLTGTGAKIVSLPPVWLHLDSELQRLSFSALSSPSQDVQRRRTMIGDLAGEAMVVLRNRVLTAIQRIGPAVVPLAHRDLSDTLVGRRILAAQVLGQLGPRARDALPALRLALADPHPQVAVEAARAVFLVSGDRDSPRPVLLRHLEAPGEIARVAARTLGWMAPLQDEALRTLEPGLQHANASVRRETTRVLGLWERAGKGAENLLQERLRDGVLSVRVEAALALARIRPSFDPLPHLRAGLRPDAGRIALRSALEGLDVRQGQGRALLPLVRPLCRHFSEEVRLAAAGAVLRHETNAQARAALLQLATSPGVRIEWRMQALAWLRGPRSRSEELPLRALLLDPGEPLTLRLSAQEILASR